MPTIRIDREVYTWLQEQGRAFEDTPNSVLRRIAGLDNQVETDDTPESNAPRSASIRTFEGRTSRPVRGSQLADREGLSVKRAYYHHEGTWFQVPIEFPAALFDPRGYVVFETESEFRNTPGVEVGEKTNIHEGIWKLSKYRTMKHAAVG